MFVRTTHSYKSFMRNPTPLMNEVHLELNKLEYAKNGVQQSQRIKVPEGFPRLLEARTRYHRDNMTRVNSYLNEVFCYEQNLDKHSRSCIDSDKKIYKQVNEMQQQLLQEYKSKTANRATCSTSPFVLQCKGKESASLPVLSRLESKPLKNDSWELAGSRLRRRAFVDNVTNLVD